MGDGLHLDPGRVFQGRWKVVRRMASGGMGAIYEVVHVETQARSALKVLLPSLVHNDEMRGRFRQEALVTASIQSDHIARVFDGGTDTETGSPFIVLELLVGRDLGAELAERKRLPFDEVCLLARQVGFALAKAHDAGVVHRDLKPENLFLTRRDDGTPCVKVLDFGIAKLVAANPTHAETTRAFGTPAFMSPEQIQGEGTIGPAADLYALAHVVYALLVGIPYWAKERGQGAGVYKLLMAICGGMKEPASARAKAAGVALPPGFDVWFARAAALAPSDRFTSAAELVAALERASKAPPQEKTQTIDIGDRPTERPLVARPKEPENKRTAPLGHGPIADPLPAELRRGDYAAVRPRPGPTVVSDDVDPAPIGAASASIEPAAAPPPTLAAPSGSRRAARVAIVVVLLLGGIVFSIYWWVIAPRDTSTPRAPSTSSTTR